jgi:hypothetical protein
MSTRVIVGVVWLLSLLLVHRLASAQGDPLLTALQPPVIYSGDDVGFRVHHRVWEDKPVGEIVVRVNGKWQEVQLRLAPTK